MAQCPLCGTNVKDQGQAKPTAEGATIEKISTLRDSAIPAAHLPEIKNSCPLCALEVNVGATRCPRCGVPLKGVAEPTKPPAEPPASVPSVTAPTSPVIAREEPTVVLPPPSKPPPSPAPPMPEELPETSRGTVTAAPTTARTSSQGLVNGRGAINGTGLVNGRGMVNGTGLVNGTGMVNGTGRGAPDTSSRAGRTTLLKRWQFVAILVVIVIILPTFVFLSYDKESDFVVDGDFAEWDRVTKFGMQAPADVPEVSVQEWAVKSDASTLYMYLKTESNVMGSSEVDSYYLFVDSDGNSETGYVVSSIGADYMLGIHGWNQTAESASLMRFDSTTDRYNWTSWTDTDSLTVATEAERMEAMASLPVSIIDDSRFVLLAQDNLPDQASSISYPVPEKGGALIIKQEIGSDVSWDTGLIPAAYGVSLARLIVKCEGSSGTVSSISPVVSRVDLASQIVNISLSPGESRSINILVDSSAAAPGSLASAYVIAAGVSSTFSDVVVIGEPVRAYVTAKPTSILIDGAFGDWYGHYAADTDTSPVANPNVNMTEIGFVNATTYAAFYVSVQGQVFQGSYAPTTRGKPTSQGGGGPVIPQRKSGEDVLRVYIDSDTLNATGELVQRYNKVIGADYLLELEGVNGRVASKTLMKYESGEWTTVQVSIAAAVDSQRMEVSVPSVSMGSTTSFSAIVETTDWRSRSDWAWAGTLPDPWVIDSSGNAYMTNDGSTWSYLGTPTLEPGDRIVDIAVSIGAQGGDIFLVTNTGRTYYWVPGESTNWTAGETNPIDVANYSEAASMSFYQNAGAWLLTRNGSYFWLMDAHKSTKEWTYQDIVGSGISDLTDLVYSGGTMYALRSTPNTGLNYSNNGNTFTSVTNPTGSTSNHTQFTYINNGPGSADDVIYVLCENGNIRYSSNGGQTWSAKGDLPVPTGSNTSKYAALGIDPDGYMWVVTDTGYTYRSTDTTTYNSFTCVGQSPISGIVAILPTVAVIPEFPIFVVPILIVVILVVVPSRIRRGRRQVGRFLL